MKTGKSYQENYMPLFPRYVSAIDEEQNLATLKIKLEKTQPGFQYLSNIARG